MRVKVVKSVSASALESRINDQLIDIGDSFVDLKLAGSFDGKEECFLATIIYNN